MGLVHTLVAEVLADFIHALEATNDKSLQIQLCSDAHVHVDVQRIEVRDEGTSRSTARNALQCRGLHLGIASLVQYVAHGAQYGGTLQESFLHAVVYNQIDITLAIAQFGVVERVKYITLCICLYDGQRFQALAQYGHFRHMHTDFACLCAEDIALHTNKVAQVKALLENYIIEVFILVGTNAVALYVHLNPAFRILQFGKSSFAHNAFAHDASCNAHHRTIVGCGRFTDIVALLVLADDGQINKVLDDVRTPCVYGIFSSRVGVDAHLLQLL